VRADISFVTLARKVGSPPVDTIESIARARGPDARVEFAIGYGRAAAWTSSLPPHQDRSKLLSRCAAIAP
jgi:hypothetical protein